MTSRDEFNLRCPAPPLIGKENPCLGTQSAGTVIPRKGFSEGAFDRRCSYKFSQGKNTLSPGRTAQICDWCYTTAESDHVPSPDPGYRRDLETAKFPVNTNCYGQDLKTSLWLSLFRDTVLDFDPLRQDLGLFLSSLRTPSGSQQPHWSTNLGTSALLAVPHLPPAVTGHFLCY